MGKCDRTKENKLKGINGADLARPIHSDPSCSSSDLELGCSSPLGVGRAPLT